MTDIRTLINTMVDSAAELEAEVSRLRKENSKLATNNNRKKLTLPEVRQIRHLHSTRSLSQSAIADSFDLNRATVSRIVRHIYWA